MKIRAWVLLSHLQAAGGPKRPRQVRRLADLLWNRHHQNSLCQLNVDSEMDTLKVTEYSLWTIPESVPKAGS